ncbi:MAG: hypothetical protein CMN56_07700 [Sneathiella sp.]|nr:hypothetical protein [Sneathiella sp.]
MPKLGVTAIYFVLQNIRPCLHRAALIILISSIIVTLGNLADGVLASWASFFLVLLYAVFAVSWHRYSLIPGERNLKGFAVRLGMREVKYGLFALFASLLLVFIGIFLAASLPEEIALVLTAIVMLFPVCILAFFYPAIALDQPIRLGLFLTKAVEYSFSIVLAFLFWLLISGGLIGATAAISLIIGSILSSIVGGVIMALGLSVVFSVTLAVWISTVTFLYYNVIGLREYQETA